MIFWDASALVPLLIDQKRSSETRAVLERDPGQIVWWASSVECASAISRVQRLGELQRSAARQARAVLARLSESWAEVAPTAAIRQSAELLLRRHPLRAADALQLAAALAWAHGRPSGHRLLSFDDRLRDAADLEGFDLVEI